MAEKLGPFELGKVHCVDAIDGMSELPGATIDAVITDPQYCSGAIGEAQRTRAKTQGVRNNKARFNWFKGDNMGTAGLSWLLRALGLVSLHVSKESASVLVFCVIANRRIEAARQGLTLAELDQRQSPLFGGKDIGP